MATVLVTGGAGYIGTHIITVLAAHGHESVCVDNYANSSPQALERVREITGGSVHAYEVDVRDAAGLKAVLARHEVDSVIHMAGLKAVGESVAFPERYYDNNVTGTRTLLAALAGTGARNFVFSSSATVYGMGEKMPLSEDARTAPINPYGESKLEVEHILAALARSDSSWRVANLRYFNPVGAHPSGRIGEDPAGIPNNLMPFICQVATGRLESLRIFGADYPTKDGTCVRDYIHVMDLAYGHVAALDAMQRMPRGTAMTVNLGTGNGVSVLEMVETFERVSGVPIPRKIVERREGDAAVCYADPSRAKELLGWEAKFRLEEMCRDAWNWQKNNPLGYSHA